MGLDVMHVSDTVRILDPWHVFPTGLGRRIHISPYVFVCLKNTRKKVLSQGAVNEENVETNALVFE